MLAEAAAEKYPVTADFLAGEVERATIVPDTYPLPGIVGMESDVTFRDDISGPGKARHSWSIQPPPTWTPGEFRY